jgi:hypothetical protein
MQVLLSPQKFEIPPFLNGCSYSIKNYGIEVIFSGMTSLQTLEKGGGSIFVHKNLKFTKINLEDYCKDQDLEACALKLDSTFSNIYILETLIIS